MRLKSVVLKNFRGYLAETIIDIDTELTAFVGRNDAGKSTVLEALEIFYNNDTVKIDPGDLNVSVDSKLITIGCIFDELPSEVVVDERFPTTFEQEYLTNGNGDIEIRKEYKVQASVSAPNMYIRANHPSYEGVDNLHLLKIADLKILGRERGAEDQVEDQRVSSLWRKAIWSSVDDLQLATKDLDVNDLGTESKAIYSKIDSLLPTFALFKVDRASSDVDPEAKNPMQAAVKQAQKDLQAEIQILQGKIEESVLEVANRTLDKIKEMDPNLANELKPKFKDKPKWTFNFTLDGDGGVPINKRGSGVRRLILLNFFRAEAEKKRSKKQSTKVIYAIEEPETSQHPNYQMMLIDALMRLAERDDCQILITTHVPALAGLLPTNAIRFVKLTGGNSPEVFIGDDTVLEEAAKSLGVLPESGIASANAVLLVEGHSDITFVNHAANALKEAGHIKASLMDKRIAPIPIGGCGNLKHWVTKKLIDQLGLEWGVLMDSDNGDPIHNSRNVKKIEEIRLSGKVAILTRKREAENYIAPDVINSRSGVTVTFTDTCDAKRIIATATKTRPEDVLEKFWPFMTADQIIESSKYSEDGSEKVEMIDMLNEVLTIKQD